MKKIRYSLAIIALLATLGGSLLQGMGSMANAASSSHASSASAAAQLTRSIAFKLYPPCPVPGAWDC